MARPPRTITALQRFWAMTAVGGRDECWLWEGRLDDCGYGVLRVSGRTIYAHRFAYERFVAELADGLNVMHRCGQPSCVNPAHLFTGTQADTIALMWVRGHGKANPRTEEQRALSRQSAETRFWARVDKSGPGGCWIWTGARTGAGYGRLLVGGRGKHTHRLSYEIHHGPIPDGLVVRHRCDVRACVNPDHLELGTQRENVRDARQRGRMAIGERHPNSKLTSAAAAEIRRRYIPRVVTLRALADEYGVTQGAIHAVISGRRWADP